MRTSLFCLTALALVLSACSDPAKPSGNAEVPAAGNAAVGNVAVAATPAPLPPVVPGPPPLAIPDAPVVAAPSDPQAVAVNGADGAQLATASKGVNPALVRAEVLLAPARFSPGVIDGQDGANLKSAVAAYKSAHSLSGGAQLDAATWQSLTGADAGPAIVNYVISDDDVRGPFLAKVPTDFREMSKLPALSYTSPLEGLAEKFHMDEALLKSLNPGVDFAKAGQTILVAAVGPPSLSAPVTAIEVDKSARQVRAYGAAGQLLAVYPATVGSTERPAPSGIFKVKGVAPHPDYTYDPKRLTFGKPSQGVLTIKPGPNNPVGAAWIDLDIPTYGIHGAPEPKLVGKVASHGCVRLTNWDVSQLAAAVKPGTKVTFIGEDAPAAAPAKG